MLLRNLFYFFRTGVVSIVTYMDAPRISSIRPNVLHSPNLTSKTPCIPPYNLWNYTWENGTKHRCYFHVILVVPAISISFLSLIYFVQATSKILLAGQAHN